MQLATRVRPLGGGALDPEHSRPLRSVAKKPSIAQVAWFRVEGAPEGLQVDVRLPGRLHGEEVSLAAVERLQPSNYRALFAAVHLPKRVRGTCERLQSGFEYVCSAQNTVFTSGEPGSRQFNSG